MTISTEVRKAGPYNGNGTATTFPFAFKVFSAEDLVVVRRQTDAETDTTLVLTSDYTVVLNGDQDASPGGSVTLTAGVLPSGYTLVISSDLPFLQPTDLTNQGAFYPKVITNALDRLTIFCQQLAEGLGRALTLPITAPDGVSTELPFPTANNAIGWNEDGTALRNISPQELATIAAYGDARADQFTGDGVTTVFNLTASPGGIGNLDVSIAGVTQRPNFDYTWTAGTTLTFVAPPPAPGVPGAKNILARYSQALPFEDSALRVELGLPGGADLVATDSGGSVQEYIDHQSYNTVAAMVADASLKVGDTARWAGYYNVFDGGGNVGVVVAAGTGTADGGSFINLANGLQVKANMSDGIFVDRWGPVNPNAHLAFEKAIAYAVAHPSAGAFGPEIICGTAAYYETSIPIFFSAAPLVGVVLNLRRSTIKKVTNTPASGKATRLARGGSVNDVMNVDAVLIYDHPDNAYYVRGGIKGDGYIRSDLGNGVWAPRCYLMNFDEVTIDAPNGAYGWKTHDTFMCKFHSFQSIGAERPIWWANDGSNAATGTTCHFSRVWALGARIQAWDMYGLLYSSYDGIGADNITAVGAQGAYRFELCNGHISGLGAENTNTVETLRFIGGQMTIDGIVTFSPTASGAWLRATDAARVSFTGARSDNVLGALANGAIRSESGATIIYDGSGPANGARSKDNASRLIRQNELTGYIAEVNFTVSAGVLTVLSSDGGTITRSAAGVYPFTFTATQPDTNYQVDAFIESSAGTPVVPGYSGKTTSGFNLTSRDFAGTATDCVSGTLKIRR